MVGIPSTSARRRLLILLLCFSGGCQNESGAAETAPPDPTHPAASLPADPLPDDASPERAQRVLTREAAAEAGLPPLEIHLPAPAPLVITRRLSEGRYLSLSEPTGAPLRLSLLAYRDRRPGLEVLEGLVRSHFEEQPDSKPLQIGAPSRWPVSGSERLALPLVTGRGASTTSWCAAMIPATKGAREGLWLLAGSTVGAGTPPDCELAVGQIDLARLVAGLSVH